MIEDPARARVAAELARREFAEGVAKGRWRVVGDDFPRLDIVIAATQPDGTASEYGFRFELTNFPATAPMVRIWDFGKDEPLEKDLRPKGNRRIEITFQKWSEDTVYRPWDRQTGPHISNAASVQHLAWRVDRPLTFILEDLHGILNLHARAHRLRPAA